MKPTVAVIGGGPAGAAAAIGLAQRGVNAVVLDAAPKRARKIGECLPPISNPLLDLLEVRNRLSGGQHLQSHGIRCVWGNDELADRDFLFERCGPGWHLDRSAFENELASVAQGAGAQWRGNTRMTSLVQRDRKWVISADAQGDTIVLTADYVIDATGRQACVCRKLGARRIWYDRLIGVEAVFTSTNPQCALGLFSLVEAISIGWWYSAPLPGECLSVVLMTDADLPVARLARSPAGWRPLLQYAPHTSRRVAEFTSCVSPLLNTATAATSRLVQPSGNGWVAIGDAAMTFDPLSSHGIYSALAGGYQAGRAVGRLLDGEPADLYEYLDAMDNVFQAYLALRDEHYAMERRWPAEPFWIRRQR